MMDLTDLFCKSFDNTIYNDLVFGVESVTTVYLPITKFYVININFFSKFLFETSVYYDKAFTVSNLVLKPQNSFIINFSNIETTQKLYSTEVYKIDCIIIGENK